MGLVTQSESGFAVQSSGGMSDRSDLPGGNSPSAAQARHSTAWRLAFWQVGLVFAVITLAYWKTAASIVEIWWRSETFNHGFLILPIAAYLAWTRYQKHRDKTPDGSWLGLAVIAMGAVAWWLGEAADAQLISHFAFVILLQGGLLATLGWRCYIAMLFPALYLFLMVPFGEFAISPLQDLTAHYTVMMARASGVPVFIDGRYIDIPGGSFLVAEACSGVRYLIATIALGLLIQDLLFVSRWRKALIIVLSVVVPIVANVIRAYMILMMAYLSDFKIAVGVDHIIYGWFFFAVVTMILIAIAFRFREDQAPRDEVAFQAPASQGRPLRSAAPFAAALCLAVLMPLSGAAYNYTGQPITALALPEPQLGTQWRLGAADPKDWSGNYPKADATMLRRFAGSEGEVDLFVASYAWERPEAELITFGNTVFAGRRWDVIGVGGDRTNVENEERALATLRIKHGEHQRLIWYYFRVGHDHTADPRLAKLLKVKAKLLHGHSQASVVAISTEIGDDGVPGARARLAGFFADLRLEENLDRTLTAFADREKQGQRVAERKD